MVITSHFTMNGTMQSLLIDFDNIPYPHKAENLMLERAIKMKEVLNYLCEERREFIEYNIDSWGNIELITKYLSVFN